MKKEHRKRKKRKLVVTCPGGCKKVPLDPYVGDRIRSTRVPPFLVSTH